MDGLAPIFTAKKSVTGQWCVFHRDNRMDWNQAIRQQTYFMEQYDETGDPHSLRWANEIEAAFQEIERISQNDHESL